MGDEVKTSAHFIVTQRAHYGGHFAIKECDTKAEAVSVACDTAAGTSDCCYIWAGGEPCAVLIQTIQPGDEPSDYATE